VELDSVLTDAEPLGDRLIWQAERNQLEYLALAGRQLIPPKFASGEGSHQAAGECVLDHDHPAGDCPNGRRELGSLSIAGKIAPGPAGEGAHQARLISQRTEHDDAGGGRGRSQLLNFCCPRSRVDHDHLGCAPNLRSWLALWPVGRARKLVHHHDPGLARE
jgi:hypothetical protein